VTHTIVGGEVICRNGVLTRVDADVAFAEGRAATAEWLSRNRTLLNESGLAARIAPELLHT
jgi:hypothetical protein